MAFDLMNEYNGLSARFDEVLAMVHMLQSLEIIVVDEILDDKNGLIYHQMKISL